MKVSHSACFAFLLLAAFLNKTNWLMAFAAMLLPGAYLNVLNPTLVRTFQVSG
jgi:hypothetical protein